MGTKKECKSCSGDFNPNNHKVAKALAVGVAATYGAAKGSSYGIISGGPGGGATGAGVGAALLGGATAFGAKSVTKCPNCGKKQLY